MPKQTSINQSQCLQRALKVTVTRGPQSSAKQVHLPVVTFMYSRFWPVIIILVLIPACRHGFPSMPSTTMNRLIHFYCIY